MELESSPLYSQKSDWINMNPAHSFTLYFPMINFNIILQSTSPSPKWYIPLLHVQPSLDFSIFYSDYVITN
jgi:hypothetical protein